MRVDRCFAFVDLCGFTAFTERYGDEHTVVVLANFRTKLREIAARRGVRITKWLGDGAMLSSQEGEPVVSLTIELAARTDPRAVPLQIRGGLALGPVVMFEGDDYIGRAINVAARLCDAATPGQVLATREVVAVAPRWVAAGEPLPYEMPGFDRTIDACRLEIGKSAATVTDSYCGLVIPADAYLATRVDGEGEIHYFCSTACALAWEQEQRVDLSPLLGD